MDKRYDHQQHEQQTYQMWHDAAVFNPDNPEQPAQRLTNQSKHKPKSFCILMPPPNANDPLHIGHALFVALEDILTRYHRMKGDDTLWLPGTDHAGIETQYVFEKKLAKKDQTRFDFDRETLYQMIWSYVQEKSDVAVNQLKKLGASADWSRFKFMLDKDIVELVNQTFSELHEQDLVYRDLKLINYCPHCGTGFSDLEVKHREVQGKLYYLKYGPLTVATTRPETMFADVAVAVHPDDERYQTYLGQTLKVETPAGSLKLKVIADEAVDPEFGTGALKITPAHDFTDYEIWQRHQKDINHPQPMKPVIDYRGHMLAAAGPYEGQYLLKARKNLIKDLAGSGLLVKTDDQYHHQLSQCYRCNTTIEPLPLPQFFIKVKSLAERSLETLTRNEVKVFGAGHDKILRHWLENLHDWNISRQIVWGIRLPVWYKLDENPKLHLSFLDKKGQAVTGLVENLLGTYGGEYRLKTIKNGLQTLRAPLGAKYVISPTAPGENYLQETDTYDTWFSSAQWPFTTLKTQNQSVSQKQTDFERFYPTNVMETGYDILPFWVMRMLMISLFKTGQAPFKKVYLHGLIRDRQGQKMSKSKGNVINPLEIIDQYGADALRMALVIRSTPGLDKAVGKEDFKAMRNLTNKIWNASRYLILSQNFSDQVKSNASGDKAFYQQLAQLQNTVTQELDQLKIGLVAEKLYNEFWHWFCDEKIEEAKSGQLSQKALLIGLSAFLKMLHPYIPYVTESIWQELQREKLLEIDGQNNHQLLALTRWESAT